MIARGGPPGLHWTELEEGRKRHFHNSKFTPTMGPLLGRQYGVTGGLIKCSWCFFFSTRNLQAPSADRRQTLPHDRKLTQNYKLGLKIRGPLPPPKKKWGPKTCEISASFGPLQTLISNISGTTQDIQNRKANWSRAKSAHSCVPWNWSGELLSTN